MRASSGQRVYDRLIRRSGRGRHLSVTSFVPQDWEYTRISVLEERDGEMVLRLERITLVVGPGGHHEPLPTE